VKRFEVQINESYQLRLLIQEGECRYFFIPKQYFWCWNIYTWSHALYLISYEINFNLHGCFSRSVDKAIYQSYQVIY